MDFKIVLGFVATHFVMVAGITLALFFTTCTILLIRSIGQKEGGGHGDLVDLEAIEGALKRVLSSQPLTIAVGSGLAVEPEGESSHVAADGSQVSAPVEGKAAPHSVAGPGVDPEKLAQLQTALREKEANVEKLTKELQAAKAAAPAAAGDSSPAQQDAELKIEELQARLAEYEIIEDDIADLSMYKEENARMKDELAAVKAQAAAAPAPALAAAPAAPVVAEPLIKFEKTDSFELDPNDDVMKQFAAAVSEQRAPTPPTSVSLTQPTPANAETAAAQAAIDAMLSASFDQPAATPKATAIAAPTPTATAAASEIEAAQAAIDAMLAASFDAPAAPAPSANLPESGDPQAAIDAMLAASLDVPAAPAVTAEPREEPLTDPLTDPLAGLTDPEKMLSEVAAMPADAGDGSAALDDSLDTDKLLAEVDQLKAATPTEPDVEADPSDAFAHFNKAAQG